MYAIWVSLNEIFNCGRKLTDVIPRPEKIRQDRRGIFTEESSGIELVHQMEEQIYGENHRNDLARRSTYPSKDHKKVREVIRVNNSTEMVERFEMYRERVKKRARERYKAGKSHLRSMVDGKELLPFYGTTMNCCTEKPNKNGIQLSTSSDDLREDMVNITKGKNVKRPVTVCQAIAGTVTHMDDEESPEEYDSAEVEGGHHPKSEYLVVRNPSSVLP
ncbi:hypothetical protein NMG60_11002131 [Bertholletia excelsa]